MLMLFASPLPSPLTPPFRFPHTTGSPRTASGAIAVLAGVCLLTACGQPPGESGQQPSALPRLLAVAESASYRQEAARIVGEINWVEATAPDQHWTDTQQDRQRVQAAIRTAAPALAAVDYASLSLPDFVNVTRALRPDPTVFDGSGVEPDATGIDKHGNRWALYRWQGPEFPQLPGRPLVHRWVQVYALYDTTNRRVAALIATIYGEVHE